MTASRSDPRQVVEYEPGEPFPGQIGRTLDQSSPAWPAQRRAPREAPNVILFMWDDVGYGQLSPFGGLCPTPNFDRVAQRGLRYTNFHTTALCSPSRGALLTGRNHHALGMSAITGMSMGFPAHDAFMGFEHGFLSEMLLEHGYNTFGIGKWHLTPSSETTAAGPFHRWPLGRGFERFYGFLAGETDHWYPDLIHDNHWVPAPATPEEGYHLNIDLADHAIQFIKDSEVHAPDKPFFLYYAAGAGHAPHHVEREWIDKHRGRFDGGWDEYRREVFERQKAIGIVAPDAVMTESDPDVPPWDSLSDEAKRMYARQMEVYAAFLEQTDHHFGRVLDYVESLGELDNTIVVMMSDNGASAEGGVSGTFNEGLFFNNMDETLEDNLEHFDEWGGPNTFPHYSWGWTWSGDTPFRRWKRETYRGGVSAPCIVSWPERIKAHGELRDQYSHLVDIVPTLLDVLGIDPPASIRGVQQSELHGHSFANSFDDPSVASEHVSQYFEMFASRSMYLDGWKANCPVPGPSFAEAAEQGRRFGQQITADMLEELDRTGWELYDVVNDPCETRNLADEHPEQLARVVARWYEDAERFGVFPLASAHLGRFLTPRPTVAHPSERSVWYPGAAPTFHESAPKLANRTYAMTAQVTIPEEGANGILLTHGNRHGGYAFMVRDGHAEHVTNVVNVHRYALRSPDPLPVGDVTVRYEFVVTGPPQFREGRGAPGQARLYVNGDLVAASDENRTIPNRFGTTGFSCGYAAYDSVAPDMYTAPFEFTGTLHEAAIDVSGDVIEHDEAEIRRMMVEQ